MDFNEYQQTAMQTAVYPTDQGVVYTALGLASEAGEVTGKVKKVIRDNDGRMDTRAAVAIAAELGDVLWYVAALAAELNVPLDVIAQANLQKLADRQARNMLGGNGDNR